MDTLLTRRTDADGISLFLSYQNAVSARIRRAQSCLGRGAWNDAREELNAASEAITAVLRSEKEQAG